MKRTNLLNCGELAPEDLLLISTGNKTVCRDYDERRGSEVPLSAINQFSTLTHKTNRLKCSSILAADMITPIPNSSHLKYLLFLFFFFSV